MIHVIHGSEERLMVFLCTKHLLGNMWSLFHANIIYGIPYANSRFPHKLSIQYRSLDRSISRT